jgi:hypothetical protein
VKKTTPAQVSPEARQEELDEIQRFLESRGVTTCPASNDPVHDESPLTWDQHKRRLTRDPTPAKKPGKHRQRSARADAYWNQAAAERKAHQPTKGTSS